MNRKSFILHKDSLVILEKMTNEQAGIFIKKIYEYQMTGNYGDVDFALEIALTPFINQFKRDADKYMSISEKNKQNALKRWNATASDRMPKKRTNAINADNDNDSKKDNDNNNDSKKDNDNNNDSKKDKKQIPSFDEFMIYAFEKKSDIEKESLRLKYEAWIENGWKDGNNKPIKNLHYSRNLLTRIM